MLIHRHARLTLLQGSLRLLAVVVVCGLPAARSRALAAEVNDAEETALVMEEFVITGERLTVSDVEGPRAVDRYDITDIEDSGAFSLDEFLETLPPGQEGGEQLVLINGEPAYIDVSMLPLSMIEGIDVSPNGSMPQFGARASGQVINIRLKENYQGGEIGGRMRLAFAGGGDERAAKVSGAVTRGKFRAFFSFERRSTHALLASDRAFSREQDHTARGGRDLRLSWGYPAVAQALSGVLEGLTDANGDPVAAALAPEGQNGSALVAGDFLPADSGIGAGAADQRRFNTSAYRMLIAPRERVGGSLGFSYAVSPRLNLSFEASRTETDASNISAPPVSPASARTLVPAAYNPFGQDVRVGLVHVEFGPTREQSKSRRSEAGLKAGGRLGESWKWNAGAGYRRDASLETAWILDPDKFAASLAASDPAARFNPFGDARSGPVNAHLYPDLTVERARRQTTESTRVDLSANGPVWRAPGGPAVASLRGRHQTRSRERQWENAFGRDEPEDSHKRSGESLSASTNIPLFGADNSRLMLRRLEVEVSGEYDRDSEGGSEREGELGFVWAPARWIVWRANLDVDSESASRYVEEPVKRIVGRTLIDPRRGSMVVTDVEEFVTPVIDAPPEESVRRSLGFTLEPSRLPGFRLSMDYDVRARRGLFEDDFKPQDIVNNEAAFPDRVVRAAPTAEEAASGLPGRILAVDTTPGSVGRAESSDIDLRLDYRARSERWGRIRLSTDIRRMLDAWHEIAPGVPFLDEGSSRYNPADWRVRGRFSWANHGWNFSLHVTHTSALAATATGGEIPAYTNVNLNAGYRFDNPVLGAFGKGLRVALGVANVLDDPPPFADVINGYRGGSPLGRTATMSFTLPL